MLFGLFARPARPKGSRPEAVMVVKSAVTVSQLPPGQVPAPIIYLEKKPDPDFTAMG